MIIGQAHTVFQYVRMPFKSNSKHLILLPCSFFFYSSFTNMIIWPLIMRCNFSITFKLFGINGENKRKMPFLPFQLSVRFNLLSSLLDLVLMFTPWTIILYSRFGPGRMACWPKSDDVEWVMRLCGYHFIFWIKNNTANILLWIIPVVIWMPKRKPNDCLLSHHCRSTFNIYESNIPWHHDADSILQFRDRWMGPTREKRMKNLDWNDYYYQTKWFDHDCINGIEWNSAKNTVQTLAGFFLLYGVCVRQLI